MTYSSNTFRAAEAIDFPEIRSDRLQRPERVLSSAYPWVVVGAFSIYWLTHLILDSHNGSSSFGADSTLYNPIAFDGVIEDRLIRFHPLTIHLALAWMKLLRPLSPWIPRQHLLAALFAAIGAAGVRAALSAFEMVVPRRYVLICGAIYASSLGIWYFSSIAESKILTATLAATYIAIYLRLRGRWRWEGGVLLTAVLGAACLNEIVSASLVLIPAVDLLWNRRLNLRVAGAITAHAAVILPVMYLLEVIIPSFLAPVGTNLESGSSFSMFWFYAQMNDHSLSSLYGFILNWLFFNIAAPAIHAFAAVPIWPNYFGYFEPSFARYFDSPTSAGLVGLSVLMVVSSILPTRRAERRVSSGIVLALLAYSAIRGAFFFMFNPAEVMLFTSAATLPSLIVLLAPFTASRCPAKILVLFAFDILLIVTNIRFMLG